MQRHSYSSAPSVLSSGRSLGSQCCSARAMPCRTAWQGQRRAGQRMPGEDDAAADDDAAAAHSPTRPGWWGGTMAPRADALRGALGLQRCGWRQQLRMCVQCSSAGPARPMPAPPTARPGMPCPAAHPGARTWDWPVWPPPCTRTITSHMPSVPVAAAVEGLGGRGRGCSKRSSLSSRLPAAGPILIARLPSCTNPARSRKGATSGVAGHSAPAQPAPSGFALPAAIQHQAS